jgi:2-keto-3-deoxy-L-fuconate dehydrogenase
MTKRLEGKRILVTAAGQGIGKASVLALAAEGAQVLATDRDAGLLAGYAGVAGVVAAKLDVLDDEAVSRTVQGMERIDVLFNCAGYVHQGDIFATTDADWDFSFNLNVRAMWKTMSAALPRLLAAGGGSIINMASVCSSMKGLPNRFLYGASKAAVIGMTKSVAADFVAKGIRCNCVCPGTVDTPSLHERIAAHGDPEEGRRMFLARQPTGKLAMPEEIAPIVVYLASDESRFATGQAFAIDGGITI